MENSLKYFDHLVSAHITATVAKERQEIEIIIHAEGFIFKAVQSSADMYASVDGAVAKVTRQIKKYKEKISRKGRHRSKDFEAETKPEALRKGSSARPEIIVSKTFAIKPMSPSEAAAQMELLDYNFFVFLNPATEQVNIIYRKGDGNYGLIEPKFWE
jgi:putative sigma-54 modulation protein